MLAFLEILIAGRYGIDKRIIDIWDKPSAWRTDCWQKSTCCCASGVGMDQKEAEQIAVNSSAIQKRLAKHNQSKHALELLTVQEDEDDPDHPDLHTKVDKKHPLGPTCSFIDDTGGCALHRLAEDGIGHAIWGLKPEGCIMYPLVSHDKASLVEVYGVSPAQVGDDIEVLSFEASAEVAHKQQCCFADGDTPFHELIAPVMNYKFGSSVKDSLYRAVRAYQDGRDVGWLKIPYNEKTADVVELKWCSCQAKETKDQS